MKGDGYAIIMQKEGVEFREAINIAERIFNQSGKVLPQRSTRGGGLSRRTRNNNGSQATSARLGVVLEPLTGHEQYVNRLAIPYPHDLRGG
jgi:hypothetical protein